jgi:hypothetical protein
MLPQHQRHGSGQGEPGYLLSWRAFWGDRLRLSLCRGRGPGRMRWTARVLGLSQRGRLQRWAAGWRGWNKWAQIHEGSGVNCVVSLWFLRNSKGALLVDLHGLLGRIAGPFCAQPPDCDAVETYLLYHHCALVSHRPCRCDPLRRGLVSCNGSRPPYNWPLFQHYKCKAQ